MRKLNIKELLMNELIIAPSVLSLDYTDTKEQLKQLNESKATWMHFDVMDGHFVPNLTFGPDILKAFKKAVDMVMDVHIMVDDPFTYANIFMDAGADVITFHYEACDTIEDCITLCRNIRARGVMAGVSVRPNTPIEPLLPYLQEMDVVLIMSVEPGFGGQSFMEHTLDKVRTLRTLIEQQQFPLRIEIDGGINKETAALARDAGCDTLVAGSYVFKSNIKEAVESLLCQK